MDRQTDLTLVEQLGQKLVVMLAEKLGQKSAALLAEKWGLG